MLLLLLQGGLLGQLLEEQRVLDQPLVLNGEDGLVDGCAVVMRINGRWKTLKKAKLLAPHSLDTDRLHPHVNALAYVAN